MTFNNECFCMETKDEFITLPCQHRIHSTCVKQMISDQCPWCRTSMGIISPPPPVAIRPQYRWIFTYKQTITIFSNLLLLFYFGGWIIYILHRGEEYMPPSGWIIYSTICVASFIILNLILYVMFKRCAV